ncbi:MAG: phosphatase PAP2 family protein [Candidatus Fimenecus sp.]
MNKSKKRLWLGFLFYFIILAVLLGTATKFDLVIDKFLTRHTLANGTYLTNDFFGATFETIGSAPIFLMIAFAFIIFHWNARLRIKNNILKNITAIFTHCAAIMAVWICFYDTLKYVGEHIGNTEFREGTIVKITFFAIGGLIASLWISAMGKLSEQKLKKLFWVGVSIIFIAALAQGSVEILKRIANRPRFRAMNLYKDTTEYGFARFAKWYQTTPKMPKADRVAIYGTTDACKSFPSGHTCAAGMSFGLILIGNALEIKDKNKRFLLYFIPIAFTVIVGFSRLRVGAHFLSDITIGGYLAFTATIIAREIFIDHGANIKAMCGKSK